MINRVNKVRLNESYKRIVDTNVCYFKFGFFMTSYLFGAHLFASNSLVILMRPKGSNMSQYYGRSYSNFVSFVITILLSIPLYLKWKIAPKPVVRYFKCMNIKLHFSARFLKVSELYSHRHKFSLDINILMAITSYLHVTAYIMVFNLSSTYIH